MIDLNLTVMWQRLDVDVDRADKKEEEGVDGRGGT